VDRPQRYRVEGQDLFRQLGVQPDANFEEIKAAVRTVALLVKPFLSRMISVAMDV
jgi:hypothetical protein